MSSLGGGDLSASRPGRSISWEDLPVYIEREPGWFLDPGFP